MTQFHISDNFLAELRKGKFLEKYYMTSERHGIHNFYRLFNLQLESYSKLLPKLK